MKTDAINETPKCFNFTTAVPSGFAAGDYAVMIPAFDWTDTELRSWLADEGAGRQGSQAQRSELRERAQDLALENDVFAPQTDLAYPLPRADAQEAAETLAKQHSSLTVVEIYGPSGAEVHLALTAGGMNLSWEICEAYIALGYHPPTHFCDLPAMAGRADKHAPYDLFLERDRATIAACLESLRIAGVWIAGSEASVRARFEL